MTLVELVHILLWLSFKVLTSHWNVQQVSQVWSVANTTNHSNEWDVNTLKKLASVWQTLKDRNQARHYKRSAAEDLSPVSCKMLRRIPDSTPVNKSISVCVVPSIVSDQLELNPAIGSATPNSNRNSTPVTNHPNIEA